MAPSRASRARRTTSRRRSAFAALTIAVLGLLLPGTAYLAARRTKLGSTLIVLSLALYGGAAYVGLRKRDAVIGWALENDRIPLTGTVLLVSGRASFELTQKAVMAGIPLLAAVSAPSSLAVDLASQAGLTLVAFLRGESMNVYTRPDRIVR